MNHCVGRAYVVLAVALPILAGACVPAEDALTPKVAPTLDAALADIAHPALNWAEGFFSGAGAIPSIVPTRCPFDAASQYFVCSPLVGGDITLNQRFTLLDAGGGKQSAFDATSTVSLHLENAVTSSSLDGQQVLDLTGLATARHTLNGTSLTVASYTAPSGSRYTSERRTTITDLVLPIVAPGAPVGWPLSGTIDTRSRDIFTTGDTIVFIATMRFDGSSVVTLTLTVPGGIQTCRLNLALTLGIGCVDGASPTVPVGGDALPGAMP